MKRSLSFSLAIFTMICLLVATDRHAWGYVDPGSGLLALQTAASVMTAFGYFLRRRIRALFTRKKDPVTVKLTVAVKEVSPREVA